MFLLILDASPAFDYLDPLTSFADPKAREVVQTLSKMPMFASISPCVIEIRQKVLPEPVECEGIQCVRCQSPIIRSNPMDFYGESIECCEAAEIDAEAEIEAEDYDEDAFDAYIDAVLDGQYMY